MWARSGWWAICFLFFTSVLGASDRDWFPQVQVGAPDADALDQGWRALLADGDLPAAETIFRGAYKKQATSHLAYSLSAVLIEQARYRDAISYLHAALDGESWSSWHEQALLDLSALIDELPVPDKTFERLKKRFFRANISWEEQALLRPFLSSLAIRLNRLDEHATLSRDPALPAHLLVCGPFPNRDGGRFGEVMGPELDLTAIDLSASYSGRGRRVGWRSLPVAWDGQVALSSALYPAQEGCAYVLALIEAEAPGPATLVLGAGGALAVWVNGQAVLRDDCYGAFQPIQRQLPLALEKGRNWVLCKVAGDRQSDWALAMRLVPLPAEALSRTGSASELPSGVSWVDISQGDTRSAMGVLKIGMAKQTPAQHLGLRWGAASLMDRCIAKDPTHPLALAVRAYMHMMRGTDNERFMRSRPLLEVAAKAAPRSSLVLGLAAAVQPDENASRIYYQKAIAASEQALAIREYGIGQLMAGAFNREAEREAQALLKVAELPSAANTLASIYGERGWVAESRQMVDRALAVAPFWDEPLLARIDLALTPAEQERRLLAALKGAGVRAVRRRLIALYEGRREYSSALKLAQAEARIYPYDPEAQLRLAQVQRAMGHSDGAVATLQAGLAWMPESPRLLEQLGRFELDRGNRAGAIAAFGQLLDVRPDATGVVQYIKELQPQKRRFYADYDIPYEALAGRDDTSAQHPLFNSLNLLDQCLIMVNPNGTQRRMVRSVRKVLRQRGIRGLSQQQIPFDPARQRVEVIHARVIQSDGTVIENAMIGDQGFAGKMGGGIYGSYSLKRIRFPQVQEGSVVDLQYTVEDTEANVYSDEFEYGFFFGSTDPTARFDFTVVAPKAMGVRHGEALTEIRPVVRDLNETLQEIRYQARNLTGIEIEPAMPQWEVVPSLRVGSFADWNEVGLWYWRLQKPQLILPQDILDEVKALVKPEASREDKISAVFNWVTKEIRYVSISFGLFGCKPHKAERTYRALYGDCKDTAVLMCAMLKALGVDSRVALVRTFDRGKEPTGIPGARLFNHAITYVPPSGDGENGVWLDGTTDYFVYGELPPMDHGAMALLTGPDGGTLVTIDPVLPEANGQDEHVTFMLAPGGGGGVKVATRSSGAMAPMLRRLADTPDRLKQGVTVMINGRYPGSSLDAFAIEAKGDQPAELTFDFSAPCLAQRQQAGTMRLRPVIMPAGLSRRYAVQKTRQHDMMLGVPMRRIFEAEIHLHDGATVVSLPQPRELNTPVATYKRTCTQNGKVISIRSCLVMSARRLAAKDYEAFKRFCHDVDAAEEEWVVYREPPVAEAQNTPPPLAPETDETW